MKVSAKNLKITAIVILYSVSAAFAAESYGIDALDNFAAVSPYDGCAWAALFLALATVQVWLLRCSECLKCRAWGDFLLQISGLCLLLIGFAFIAAYPPFSWFMGVFPILGMLFVFAGRMFGNNSRFRLRLETRVQIEQKKGRK